MAILKIVQYPSSILKKKTRPVTEFNDETFQSLLKNMAETMYGAPGVGLAANQVAVSLRAAVIDTTWKEEDGNKELRIFINPEIVEKQDPFKFEEGCLSLPGVSATINRFKKVTVKYYDPAGKKKTLKAEGLLAIALQHETDHLDGKLYIDHLSPLKREMVLAKFKKLKASRA